MPAMRAQKPGEVRIGVSGWRYAGWRKRFYPKGLTQREELAYMAQRMTSIEINGTFYALQRPESFAHWDAETPQGFRFAVKGPRFITHIRRLKEVEGALANFFASGVLALGAKLGPVLWQFPPNFRFEADRFGAFLDLLPHDTVAAAALARRHEPRMTGRTLLAADARRKLRHAVEIRNDSFAVPEFVRLLRRHRVALVCADSVAWPCLMDVTADFVYCRLHGSQELYASGYDDAALDAWAARVTAWAMGGEPDDATRVIARPAPRRARRDVFVFFDNDAKALAPYDALNLIGRVSARFAGTHRGGLESPGDSRVNSARILNKGSVR
jgi:uncharacterized protein YecE (DUF72 family)